MSFLLSTSRPKSQPTPCRQQEQTQNRLDDSLEDSLHKHRRLGHVYCTNPVQQLLQQPHRTHWESSCNGSSSPLSGSLPPAALTRTCSTTVRQVHPQKRPVCLPGPVCPQTRPARPQREAPSTAPLLMALLPVSAVIKSRSRALTTAKVQHPKVKSKRFPTPWYSTFPEHLTFPSYISHQINTINTINKPGYRLVIPKWVANAKSPESSHSGSLANACCHVRRQRNRASTMDLFSCASVSVSDKAIHTQNKADNAL